MAAMAGYAGLIAAGQSLTDTRILDAQTELSDENLAQFLTANKEVLEQTRRLLQQPCSVPLEYDAGWLEKQGDNLTPLRNLARSFALELKAAVRLGDLPRAAGIGLDIFQLANASRRDGLIIDALVANAIEGIAIDGTRHVHRRLLAADAVRLARGLLQVDVEREPFDEIVTRDQKWEQAVGYRDEKPDFAHMEWPGSQELDSETEQTLRQLLQSLADLPADELRSFQKQLDDRNLALLRLLTLESALQGFHAGNGFYPSELSVLAPAYLTAIPRDPFTATEFRYRTTATGYAVYSPGPTGQDSGGRFGDWFRVLSGEADLCADMYDFEQSCEVSVS